MCIKAYAANKQFLITFFFNLLYVFVNCLKTVEKLFNARFNVLIKLKPHINSEIPLQPPLKGLFHSPIELN